MTPHPADAALQAHKRHHVSAQITALAQRAARQRRQRESACAQDIVALWRRLGRRDDAAFESLHQLITSAQGEQAVAAVAAQGGVPSGQSREAVAAPPGAVTGALLRHLVSLVECPFPAVASAATSILYTNVTPPACNKHGSHRHTHAPACFGFSSGTRWLSIPPRVQHWHGLELSHPCSWPCLWSVLQHWRLVCARSRTWQAVTRPVQPGCCGLALSIPWLSQ